MINEDIRIKQLDTLVELFGEGKKSVLARKLGMTDARVGMWYARKFIDVLVVAEMLPEVSAEWLLRNAGNPLIEKETAETAETPTVAEFHDDDKVYNIKSLLAENKRLLDEMNRIREDNSALREDIKVIRQERDMLFNKLIDKV